MPNKSVVVYGPQGCGKTTHAAALAKHFGLANIVEEADRLNNIKRHSTNALLIATERPTWAEGSRRVFSFEQAMQMAGLSPGSKKTPWKG